MLKNLNPLNKEVNRYANEYSTVIKHLSEKGIKKVHKLILKRKRN